MTSIQAPQEQGCPEPRAWHDQVLAAMDRDQARIEGQSASAATGHRHETEADEAQRIAYRERRARELAALESLRNRGPQ